MGIRVRVLEGGAPGHPIKQAYSGIAVGEPSGTVDDSGETQKFIQNSYRAAV